jgi:hypothetical protein
MKFFAVSLLASLAAATPIALPEINISGDLEARQLSSSKTELEDGRAGACPRAILVFARGSTETGNLVRPTCPVPTLILSVPSLLLLQRDHLHEPYSNFASRVH